MPRIIKSNGLREPYDYNKLRRSMALPLQKRPVSIDEIDAIVHRIEQRLRQTGEREVSSRILGEIVMGELKAIDDVAYVRFASVYRDFQDIEAFKAELENFTPKLDDKHKVDDSKSE